MKAKTLRSTRVILPHLLGRKRENPAMNGVVETALVIGATSDIGRTVAHRLADEHCALQPAARDPERLDREAQDLRLRTGASVDAHLCDVPDADGGASLLDTLDPLPDLVVCVVGMLRDQAEGEREAGVAARVMRTNYVGPAQRGTAFRAVRTWSLGRRQLSGRRPGPGLADVIAPGDPAHAHRQPPVNTPQGVPSPRHA